MAEEQASLPALLVILLVSGLVIKYFFFPGAQSEQSNGRRNNARDAAAVIAAREDAVVRLQQMFPQIDRRTLLWDLQRTGGNIAATADRIATRRLEMPPITFQPPPPPGGLPTGSSTEQQPQQGSADDKPTQPDLITRYKLHDKLAEGAGSASQTEETKTLGKAWSTNRDEKQALLQKRRDEMILAARRKMEAKMAAEKAKGQSS